MLTLNVFSSITFFSFSFIVSVSENTYIQVKVNTVQSSHQPLLTHSAADVKRKNATVCADFCPTKAWQNTGPLKLLFKFYRQN